MNPRGIPFELQLEIHDKRHLRNVRRAELSVEYGLTYNQVGHIIGKEREDILRQMVREAWFRKRRETVRAQRKQHREEGV